MFRAWYELIRELALKSGVRLEQLSDRVHYKKPMKALQGFGRDCEVERIF